ncbi:MAG TPA: sulfite exporter TauE/SafE family protein [Erythrobacter sp.]|nr:sulfite exporter TauE/SafE family protein [Erythrobacter sp.]
MSAVEIALVLLSGGLVGLVLGLVGGGGSILAVPLLIYVVGVQSTHAAIGTAAVAVALNALAGLGAHLRLGTIKWRCALVFAAAGALGAALGAEAGKAFDGQRLLTLFGILMIVVGLSMLRKRRRAEQPDVRLTRESAPGLLLRLVPIGFAVGLAAGFFGIGGGFLIVPGLVMATAMPLSVAVGTSLVVVSVLGFTTAASYAVSGFVDWQLTALLVVGGVAGAGAGARLAKTLAPRKALLERVFAGVVIAAGGYVAILG